MRFYVYILECSDHSLYTGYTTDINRRLYEHCHSRKGAKYTRSRRPLKLIYLHSYSSKSEAMSEEWRIKHRLTRNQKLELVNSSMNEINNVKE